MDFLYFYLSLSAGFYLDVTWDRLAPSILYKNGKHEFILVLTAGQDDLCDKDSDNEACKAKLEALEIESHRSRVVIPPKIAIYFPMLWESVMIR